MAALMVPTMAVLTAPSMADLMAAQMVCLKEKRTAAMLAEH